MPQEKAAPAVPKKKEDDDNALPATINAGLRNFDRSATTAILNNEIEIFPDKRLLHLDKGPVKAYEARARGDTSGGQGAFFAMLCEPHLVPQSRAGGPYSGIINPGLARMTASGPVFWPPEKRFRYCFVYENTLGQPLIKSLEQQGPGLRQDHVMKAVIKPMIGVLQDLRDADVFHGNIRPHNLFDGGDAVVERVIVGECLSTPPGYTQPALYETIERAMCDPIAKGRGMFEDDLYAFGVTLTIVMGRKNPMPDMSDEDIIRQKIEIGSYAAMTGKERYTGAVLELLRGLLYDDRSQRWTLDEILAWMEGQHLSPKQGTKKKKAARPLLFNEERYSRQSLLAMDLDKNQAEAVQMIDNSNLEQWITRSLEDSQVKTRYDQALAAAQEQGRGPGYWDRLLSRVSIALDPEAPIRFRGMKAHPEGIAYALAEAYVLKKDLQPFADIISQQLVMFWLTMQTDLTVDVGATVSRYDSCRAFLRQATIGYGMERCFYFLNPEAPCLSERLDEYYVRSPEDFLYALEQIAGQPNRPELFIDRHIASFLSVRDRKVIDSFWNELNAPEFYRRILGNMRVAATIQRRARIEAFPGISGWLADIMEPIYERYHDRELRDRLRKKVEGLREQGDLVKIAMMFEDQELLQKDFNEFRQATLEYDELRREAKLLESKLEHPEKFGAEAGQEVAAIVSGVFSALFILGLSFLFFMKKDFF